MTSRRAATPRADPGAPMRLAEAMINRARSDLDDCNRKIAIIKAEEERLATERLRYEEGRAKALAFIEMLDRYTEARP
jgi:uncharacterized small protein (DUF1192 family)